MPRDWDSNHYLEARQERIRQRMKSGKYLTLRGVNVGYFWELGLRKRLAGLKSSEVKKAMGLQTCELCLIDGSRDCRFSSWSLYRDHMRDVHQIEVTKDGSPTKPKAKAPTTDEL